MWSFVLKDSGWAILNMTETFTYIHSLYLALVVLYIYWFSDDFIFVLWDTSWLYEDFAVRTENLWPSFCVKTHDQVTLIFNGTHNRPRAAQELGLHGKLLRWMRWLTLLSYCQISYFWLAKDGRGSFYDCRYRFPLTDELGSVSSISCT